MEQSTNKRFWILIALVMISGFSQGMLLPLIAIIFENLGISSTLNGFHATSLYIGVLLVSPFLEKPLRQFGFKPVIAIGGFFVVFSLALFPVYQSFWFWFILRFLIGIGDCILHFGIQTWITSTSPMHKRGRHIALYGLAFGTGFSIGPLMNHLLDIYIYLPFIVSSIISLMIWLTIFLLKNEFPKTEPDDEKTSSFIRFFKAWKYAWVAFLPPFAYGFLEASLHGNFPVYALRIGHNVTQISTILPLFAVGSLISQLPLGVLSDKYGRKPVLSFVLLGGFLSFFVASFYEYSVIGLGVCFLIAGMLVGSTFSLGISYMTDILPKSLLPAGNILCGALFSIGSITGPFLGGLFIQWFEGISFFYVISFTLLFVALPLFFVNKTKLTPSLN